MATQTQRAKGKAKEAASDGGVKKTLGMVTSLPARTALTRLAGVRPSRTKAFLTASAAAIAGATLVYRLLRSGNDD